MDVKEAFDALADVITYADDGNDAPDCKAATEKAREALSYLQLLVDALFKNTADAE